MISKAVILAAGRGTRMRGDDALAALTAEQNIAAAQGMKAMMPIGSHRFLDYVLTAVADAGIRDIALVVRADDVLIRERYTTALTPARVRIQFVTQDVPQGTADALRAARDFVRDDSFVMLNADNYYPVTVIRSLVELGCPALPGFDATSLTRLGDVPPDRIPAYALLRVDDDGNLADIVEKPDVVAVRALGLDAPVSMNIWAFPPAIITACDRVAPSPRGELELADAVRIAIHELGIRFRVIPTAAGVLDLSSRADVAAVSGRLESVDVRI